MKTKLIFGGVFLGLSLYLSLETSRSVVLYKPPQKDINLSINNLQDVLDFFEITEKKHTLHPGWSDFLSPGVYVALNGVLRSGVSSLSLDISQPVYISFDWGNASSIPYPVILAAIPTKQSFKATQYLENTLPFLDKPDRTDARYHGKLAVPYVYEMSLTWEPAVSQVLMALQPRHVESYDLSLFKQVAEEKDKPLVSIRGDMNASPLLSYRGEEGVEIDSLAVTFTRTELTLQLQGEGSWSAQPVPKAIVDEQFIAGWRIPSLGVMHIYKEEEGLCLAGNAPRLKKYLGINKTCELRDAKGLYLLLTSEFFEYIDVPLERIWLRVHGNEREFYIEGNIQKKRSGALFLFYGWLYQFFSE